MKANVTMTTEVSSLTLPWSAGRLAAAAIGAYGAAAVPAAWYWPSLPGSDLAAGAVLASMLIALTVIDIRSFRLPDALTLPLTVLGIGFAQVLGWASWADRAIAAAVGFLVLFVVRGVYYRVRGRHGLGLGDAKLFAAAGAWTGIEGLAGVLLSGCILALMCVGGLAMTGRQVSARVAFPFGPFLAAGIWLVWLYGPPI
jgi:prepilin signal peptidase PulO-like enzyme (type II secretory pathway)